MLKCNFYSVTNIAGREFEGIEQVYYNKVAFVLWQLFISFFPNTNSSTLLLEKEVVSNSFQFITLGFQYLACKAFIQSAPGFLAPLQKRAGNI